MIPQRFKANDELETKLINAILPSLLTIRRDSFDEFWLHAYISWGLGGVLHDLDRDSMASSIPRAAYLAAFPQIHQLFTRPGTFESYLEVFRAIWGADVDVTFSIPGNGQLDISIAALSAEKDDFAARRIVDNVYLYDRILTHSGDHVLFQVPAGLKTQAEADALIYELSPDGIYVTNDLTLS